jgi:hypothetical protein
MESRQLTVGLDDKSPGNWSPGKGGVVVAQRSIAAGKSHPIPSVNLYYVLRYRLLDVDPQALP